MSFVYSRYTPAPIGVNGSVTKIPANQTGCFSCVTTGTLSITDSQGVAVLTAFPVTLGTFYYIPFYTAGGFTVTLAGGASGTLG